MEVHGLRFNKALKLYCYYCYCLYYHCIVDYVEVKKIDQCFVQQSAKQIQ